MLAFDIVYVMFQYLVVKFCSKFIISEYCFKTVVISLWKLESLVSNVLLSWKLWGEFVRVRSIHDRLSGFLKHVFCFTKLFKLYVLINSEIFFSLTSTLKSPSRIIFSKSVQSLSKAALTLLRWKAIFSLW